MYRQVDVRPTEADLVRAARAGSVDALGELYERHAGPVYNMLLRLLGTPADAEDVLQDVFVGLPAALQHYAERGSFGAWLSRVAVRAALMMLRRPDRQQHAPLDELLHAAPAVDPTARVAARVAIAALPESLRVVFVLREIEGYSHDEIGALLDITARASALRLHRAWKVLRNRVGMP
jgi:RNA polymerase sigma-70 factor, ECF subfamily